MSIYAGVLFIVFGLVFLLYANDLDTERMENEELKREADHMRGFYD